MQVNPFEPPASHAEEEFPVTRQQLAIDIRAFLHDQIGEEEMVRRLDRHEKSSDKVVSTLASEFSWSLEDNEGCYPVSKWSKQDWDFVQRCLLSQLNVLSR